MRIILLAGLLSLLTACGGDGNRDNVGQTVDEFSNPKSQAVADEIWCSRADIYDLESDPEGRRPLQEVITFYSSGDFVYELVVKSSHQTVNGTEGQWGINGDTLTIVSSDGERTRSRIEYNAEDHEVSVFFTDDFPDVYYSCGIVE